MAGPDASAYETRADAEDSPSDRVIYWATQEKLFDKEVKSWRVRGRKVVKRYRDERPENQKGRSRFNVLWANIQVLKPTLYARTPKPDIAPRWPDQEEGPVRLAALILERGLSFICDRYNIDAVLRSAVEDRLLPGAGFARVRYKASYGDAVPDPNAPEPDEGEDIATYRPVTKEEVCWEYVFWEDMGWGPARRWEEVPWVRFRSYLTRDQLKKRFTRKAKSGKTIGEVIPLDYTPEGMKDVDAPPEAFKKAVVHEYWERETGKVVWVAPGYPDDILDEEDDPYGVDGFFPCPKPLLSTTTNDKFVPVPDFAQYQDQADELDEITGRIEKLTRALKVAGIYPGDEKASVQRLMEAGDNMLIPVEDWAHFKAKGGKLDNVIQWLPIETISAVLIRLYDARDRSKQTLYEISGLADIMRGATDPNETLGAQQLKSQYGTIRVADSQKEVGRFSRDLFRLAGELFGKHFDPATISAITGLPELPKEPPMPQPPPMPAMGMGAPAAPGAPPVAAPPAGAPPMPPGTGGPPASLPGAPQGLPPAAPPAPDPAMAAFMQAQQAHAAWQAEVARLQGEFASACALLKDDALRAFRIDIEADSTIAPDEQAEKQARTEYVAAIGKFLTQAAPLIQAMPKEGGALVSELLKFVTHAFRAGRPVQEVIDKFAEALDNLPPAQPKSDPALIKVEKDAELAQQKQAADAAAEQARIANEGQREQAKAANEAARIQAEMEMRRQEQADKTAVAMAGVAANERVKSHAANLAHKHKMDEAAASIVADHAKFVAGHELKKSESAANQDMKREAMAQKTEGEAA